MGWIHDTGYAPAYGHVGSVATILADRTEAEILSPRTEPDVIGWRAACACGWRGMRIYARSQWPSRTGHPPKRVVGSASRTAAFADWESHLARSLPELAVHYLAQRLAAAEKQMREVARAARMSGVPWSRIIATAGPTARRMIEPFEPTAVRRAG